MKAATLLAFAAPHVHVPGVEIEARFGRAHAGRIECTLEPLAHALLAEFLRRRLGATATYTTSVVDELIVDASDAERMRHAFTGDVRVVLDADGRVCGRRAKRVLESRVLVDDDGTFGADARLVAAVEIDLPHNDDIPTYRVRRHKRRESYAAAGVRVDVTRVTTSPGELETAELELELAAPLPSADALDALLALLAEPPTPSPATAARVLAKARRAANVPAAPDRTAFMPVPRTLRRATLPLDGRYVVTDKADGTRALLVIDDDDSAFLVERSLRVRRLRGAALVECFDALTVLDGELVVDVESGALAFLVFDATAVAGAPVAALALDARMARVRDDVLPALDAYAGTSFFPFAVVAKRYVPLADAVDAAVVVDAGVARATDGVIFAPVDAPYYAPTTPTYKWKPAAAATVDVTYVPARRTYVAAADGGGVATAFTTADVVEPWLGAGPPYVVECRYDAAVGRWRLVRARPDKRPFAGSNHVTTVLATIASQVDALALTDVHQQ